MNPIRVAVVISHPIQYFAPLFRELASRPEVDLEVIYGSRRGLDKYTDPGFGGREIQWDIDLLDGYSSTFIRDTTTPVGNRGDRSSRRVAPLIGRLRPAVVIIHGYATADVVVALAAAKMRGVPVLMRADSSALKQRALWRGLLRQPFVRSVFKLVDGGLAIGTRNADYYRQCGLGEEAIYFAPFSVDTNYFGEGRLKDPAQRARFLRQHGLEPERRTILFASKMVPWKRPGDVLEALKLLPDRVQQRLQVAMVGDGPLRKALQEKATHQSTDIVFPGFVNQSQLPGWYGVSDLFILPSDREAWGLVLNEAMAAGTPVIATRQAGATIDLVDEELTGFVYDAGDVRSLAGILRRVLAAPERLDEMRSRVLRQNQRWSLKATADGYVRAIEAVCDE